MKATTDTFASQLNRGLPSICLISGDEPLLVGEACDAFRAKAKSQGYTERELHFVERGFDWQALRSGSRNLSLFAERKLIEIRITGSGPGEGAAMLVEFAEQPMEDTLVLVTCEKLDGKSLATKWVSAIEKHGLLVQAWPVELPRLPAWIAERLSRHGLQADKNACQLIAERVEGNLLAAHQEVEKLALLHPPGPISSDAVLEAVADSARYDVLQLGVAAMQGQAARAVRILEGLHQEGVDATLVLWGLNKDIQWLARCAHHMRNGQSADAAMNTEYVWRPRQAAMKQALQRIKSPLLDRMMVDAANIDKAIKGVRRTDPWIELQSLTARLAGVRFKRAA